jgi:hypothetical protein
MEKTGYIELIIKGKHGIIEIKPDNYDIRNIIDDINNVENLLFPGEKRNRPIISYSIEEGSVKHIFKTSMQFILGFTTLLGTISSTKNIDFLENNTAKAFESFQESAIKKDISITIKTSLPDSPNILIDQTTNFYRSKSLWVEAEFYFYGKITNAGGKDKANIHLTSPDIIGTIIINTPQNILEGLEKNILYKTYGIRATGKQNIETGEIDTKSLQYMELIDYNAKYDEEYLKALRKRAKTWIQNIEPDTWLNEIRGRNYG